MIEASPDESLLRTNEAAGCSTDVVGGTDAIKRIILVAQQRKASKNPTHVASISSFPLKAALGSEELVDV